MFFRECDCWKPDFQTFDSVLILLCHHHMLMGLALSCILERGYRKWGEGRDVTIYPLITLHFYTFVSPIFWENQKSFFESKQIFIFIVLLSISMYVLLAPILPTYIVIKQMIKTTLYLMSINPNNSKSSITWII